MLNTHKSIEELKEKFIEAFDKGEFEWNHHEGDIVGKPISPMRIWNTFIEPTLHSYAQQQVQDAVEEKQEKIDFLRSALDWIAIVANTQSPHLGRPRSSDTSCIFCMAYLALNDGAYGEHIDYKTLSENKRKEWNEKSSTLHSKRLEDKKE